MSVKSGQLNIAEQAMNHIRHSLTLGEHLRSLFRVRSVVNDLVAVSEQSGDVSEKYLLKSNGAHWTTPKSQQGTTEEMVSGIGKTITIVLVGEKSK